MLARLTRNPFIVYFIIQILYYS